MCALGRDGGQALRGCELDVATGDSWAYISFGILASMTDFGESGFQERKRTRQLLEFLP